MYRIIFVILLSVLGLVPGRSLGQAIEREQWEKDLGKAFGGTGQSGNRSHARSGKQSAKNPKARPTKSKKNPRTTASTMPLPTSDPDPTKAEQAYTILVRSKDRSVLARAKEWQSLTRMSNWQIEEEKVVRGKYVDCDDARKVVKLKVVAKVTAGAKVDYRQIDVPVAKLGKVEMERIDSIRRLQPLIEKDVADLLNIERELAKRRQDEKRETDGKANSELEEARKLYGTARLVADAWVGRLIDKGTLQEATFLAEKREPTCLDIGLNPIRGDIRSVHYKVKYTSEAGLVNEREAWVVVYKQDNGIWQVSGETRLKTMLYNPGN